MKTVIKLSFRSLKKKPVITLINVFGLSASLVLVMVLSAYCYSQLTTDKHHEHSDRIFLTVTQNGLNTPGILKEHIDLKIPGIKSSVRISDTWNTPIFQVKDDMPIASDMIFADPDLFSLLSYNTIEGNVKKALSDPLSIVITKELKHKLFGDEPALGKALKYNNKQILTVKGVVEKPIGNTFLSFDAVTSIDTRRILQPNDDEFKEWGWCNFQTFLLLDNKINEDDVAQNIFALYPDEMQKWIKEINLMPLKDVYFSSFSIWGAKHIMMGSKAKALVLLFVAGLILVIALVNFTNISLSQWTLKINKTGVLKVIGASRFSIFRDLAVESFMLFFSSVAAAFVMMLVALPIIKNYTGINFDAELIYTPSFLIIVFTTTTLFSFGFSLISGLKISTSKAVDNLKKTVTTSHHKPYLRGGLITFQLLISIVLVSFTILVYKQVSYGSDKLVFNEKNTVAIKLTKQLYPEVLQNHLEKLPSVKKMSFTNYYPGQDISSWGGIIFNVNGKMYKDISFDTFSADASFFDIMNIKLLKGNLYSNDISKGNIKVVVNEEFLRKLDIDDPIGGIFTMNNRNFEVVGIIKDFHFKSIEKKIDPLVITNSGYNAYCLADIHSSDFKSLHGFMQDLKSTASDISPDFPVKVSFLDNAITSMYISEVRFRRIFSLFAFSAIIICALGILAISIITSQNKIKEVGIRKVNGANVREVLFLLNKDFMKWVMPAFIISCPVSWLAVNKWLENFAYKTELSWWIFALAGVLALGIALLTVSWQSWKAATRNPVEALRYE